MKSCPECNNPLERDDATFCTSCGAKVLGARDESMSTSGPLSTDVGEAGHVDVASDPVVSLESEAPLVRESGLPLTLAFNQSVFLIEGCAGVIECQITSTTKHDIEDISVSLCSDMLGVIKGKGVAKLEPGQKGEVGLGITPAAVGVHSLCLRVIYRHNDRIYATQAFHRVTVLAENASSADIKVHIETKISASDNAVISAKTGNPTGLEQLITSGPATTNELLSNRAAASWLELNLEIDAQKTRELQREHRQVVWPVRHPDPMSEPLDRVAILKIDGDPNDAILAQILSCMPITMGRLSREDLSLRVLPHNTENYEKSRLISRSQPHLILRMENESPELYDPGSANGVWLDNQRLDEPCVLNTRGPTRIDIAHVLSLQLTPIPGGDESQRYERLNGHDELWRWAQAQGISGYKIEFIEGQDATAARPPVYFPMRWIDLIDDARLGLTLSDPSGRAPIARIVRTQDGLWIEACVAGLSINAQSLDRAKAIPLEPNTTLCFNHQTIRFGEFVQFLG